MATTSKHYEARPIVDLLRKSALYLIQLAFLVLIGILQGCGTDPHKSLKNLSTQEANAARHIFQGVTKEQLLAAAEKVLTHSGQGLAPLRIIDTPNGVRVIRKWMIYGVLFVKEGEDYTEFSIREIPSGVEGSLAIQLNSFGIMVPASKRPPEGTAVYDLFWARMNYVLGRTPHWVTCSEAKSGELGIGIGELRPICNWTSVDTPPNLTESSTNGPRIMERPPREEWLAATTRVYHGIDRKRILDAAETILKQADPERFKISHSVDSLYATRDWSFYFVFGNAFASESWEIRTYGDEKALTVWPLVTVYRQTDLPIPPAGMRVGKLEPLDDENPYRHVALTNNGGQSSGIKPMVGRVVYGTALYELFFARLDYLLGLRSDWMSCVESNERLEKKLVTGDNSALCHFTLKDASPPVH